jgi:hypothetical protein
MRPARLAVTVALASERLASCSGAIFTAFLCSTLEASERKGVDLNHRALPELNGSDADVSTSASICNVSGIITIVTAYP